jgi:diguanylate cyclase (GGDEF)-like protein
VSAFPLATRLIVLGACLVLAAGVAHQPAPGASIPDRVRLVAGISTSGIGAAVHTRDVVLAVLAMLLTALVAVEVVAPHLRRRRRREDQESLELLGAALAASHDREALLPIILETAVEGTGAVGGVLLESGREIARRGQTPSLTEPLSLRLAGENGSSIVVLLYAPARRFSRAERRRAEWFAAQASVALENARRQAITSIEAVTDPLTGLANRRRFTSQLAAEAGRRARTGSPVAVITADLDDFKQVNDRYGHEAGDDVLRAFANVLRSTVREVDVAARLGGEEFAVLLPETGGEGAEVIADRLRTRLAELHLVAPDGRSLTVTASFGYASSPPIERVEELLSAADAALYRAKRGGKNRIVGARS